MGCEDTRSASPTRDEIIHAIRLVANDPTNGLGDQLTLTEFLKSTGYALSGFRAHFPQWQPALQLACRDVKRQRRKPSPRARTMPQPTKSDIVEAIRRLATDPSVRLSKREFMLATGYQPRHIREHFKDWTAARKAAGLPKLMRGSLVPDEDVLSEFHRVVCEIGGTMPTQTQFNRHSVFSHGVLRRFGGTRGAASRYVTWLAEHPEVPAAVVAPPAEPAPAARMFGRALSPVAMSTAPTNEMGVVALFAMLAARLGFVIEHVRTAFPDCQAAQCVHRSDDLWQPVQIEFEFLSRNFESHGHDPAACDLIICWRHNWPACPLPVLELSREVEKLSVVVGCERE